MVYRAPYAKMTTDRLSAGLLGSNTIRIRIDSNVYHSSDMRMRCRGGAIVIRADIESIIMASGPIPSLIVLRERATSNNRETPLRSLSIQTGSVEAAAVSRGVDGVTTPRPITHDLFLDTLTALGAKVERVEINQYDAPVFYAKITFIHEEGDSMREVVLDARPSDALALAVRANAPIYIEDDVMNRVGTVLLRNDEQPSRDEELEQFDRFVQTLSPDDF